MSKKLLIHNDNITDLTLFDKPIKFKADTSDLDKSISQLMQDIKDIDCDIIYIKDNLSSNYLELYGLRVAYHIRLSDGSNKYTPIVILSDVDSHILNQLDPIARILLTKNIFIIKNTKEAIEEFTLPNDFTPLVKENYKEEFLTKISVEAPENSVSHDITNEWAMERWSKLLDIKRTPSKLYIKYLKQKYLFDVHEINTTEEEKKDKKNLDGRLLFIDDKGSDGWNNIIETYVKKYTNLECVALQNQFNDIKNIKDSIEKSIKIYDPNIILLDLRLLKNESKTIIKISGVKILDFIKKENPSIQVIMFTASNDSSILDTLYHKRILGFVKKDSLADKYISSEDAFKKLLSLIKKATDKKYLMDVYQIQKDIEELYFLKSEDEKIKELHVAVKMVFNILDSNMPNSFTYAMYSIFKSIEIICDYYVYENKNNGEDRTAFWKNSDNLKVGNGHIATFNKIKQIAKQRCNLSIQDELNILVCTRNYHIHSDKIKEECKDKIVFDIMDENIILWMNNLGNIIKKMSVPLEKYNPNKKIKNFKK